MSKVLDAQPAAPSPAPEVPQGSAATFTVPETPKYDTDGLSTAEKQARFAEGKFPKRVEAKPAAAPTATPAGETPGTEAASETDDEEKPDETPAERRKRNRGLREELIRSNERNKILEAQIAESRKPAPAAPKDDPKPVTAPTKRPLLKDYSGENAVEKWETDLAAFSDAEMDRRIEARFGREKVTTQSTEASKSWNSQMDAERAIHADFDTVADRAIVSPAALRAITAHPKGAALLYALALPENAALAKKIFAKTDIDGLDPAALRKASANPAMRDRIQRAVGIAEAELDHLAERLATPPKDEPKPKTNTSAPDPARPAGGNGTAISDPIAAALKAKDWPTYNRLMDAKKLAKRSA